MRSENIAAQTDRAAVMTSGTYEYIMESPPLVFVLFSIADSLAPVNAEID